MSRVPTSSDASRTHPSGGDDVRQRDVAIAPGSVRLLAPDGTRVRLGELWRERPVVLALVRHFG